MIKMILGISIAVSVVALIAFVLMPKRIWTSEPATEQEFLKIAEVSGSVSIRRNGKVGFERIEPGHLLQTGDTLKTDSQSSAVLLFPAGTKIKTWPDTMLNFEVDIAHNGKVTTLTFQSGNFDLLQAGTDENLVAVLKDVPQDVLTHRVASEPMKIEGGMGSTQSHDTKSTPESTTNPTGTNPPQVVTTTLSNSLPRVTSPDEVPENSLPNDYIESVVKNQKVQFNKCYAQHLEVSPQSKGREDISYTITPEGTVLSVRLLGSTMGDKKMDDCVLEIFRRLKFKSFTSDPIIVNYPIQFE